MKYSNFSDIEIKNSNDFALPYAVQDDKIISENFQDISFLGRINSCIEDMSKFILFNLHKGKVGGRTVLSENNFEQLLYPQTVRPNWLNGDEVPYILSGLGWFIMPYRGYQVVYNGGQINGYTTFMAFLPGEKIGLVIQSNKDSDGFNQAVANFHIIEYLIGLSITDWNKRLLENIKAYQNKMAQESVKKEIKPYNYPDNINDYEGIYEHPAYGKILIKQENQKLTVLCHNENCILEQVDNDIFQFSTSKQYLPKNLRVTYRKDKKNKITHLEIPFEPSVKDIMFSKIN